MSLKSFSKSFPPFYRFLRRRLTLQRRPSAKFHRYCSLEGVSGKTLVVDVEGGMLRSPSLFPYFMLVAMEAGGFVRGLFLLLLYPLLCCLSRAAALRAMVMISFCGIKEEGFRAGRAVLPKFFLEDLGLEGFEVVRKARKRVCVTSIPRVMVEGFLKEYMEMEVVIGRELKVFAGFYTGFMEEEEESLIRLKEVLGGDDEIGDKIVGFGSYPKCLQQHFFSHCKEVYMVGEAEKKKWHPLPKSGYPKPLVFHDGRLAFRPTPSSTLAMFIWLPFGVTLAFFRAFLFMLLPNSISIPIGSFTGMRTRVVSPPPSSTSNRSHLYVCNHRTLLDPIYVSAALNKPVTAVTYSVSPISEMMSPIRTERLSRNKEEDRRKMSTLLAQGDLVVCPEGTTCREPYILRFSPLFAEMTEEVVPVALISRVGMFYGTTASGFKFLDPFFFLMNPRPEYDVVFLDEMSTGGCAAGDGERSNIEVANCVQSEIGRVLGFECTALTRKDKYMMLAGNEGVVDTRPKRQ